MAERERLIEAMANAALKARKYCCQVQGFLYGPDFVIRDCNLPWGKQEIYRAPYDEALSNERMDACHDKIIFEAALAAIEATAVVVPKEMTSEMDPCIDGYFTDEHYAAMLAASPFTKEE